MCVSVKEHRILLLQYVQQYIRHKSSRNFVVYKSLQKYPPRLKKSLGSLSLCMHGVCSFHLSTGDTRLPPTLSLYYRVPRNKSHFVKPLRLAAQSLTDGMECLLLQALAARLNYYLILVTVGARETGGAAWCCWYFTTTRWATEGHVALFSTSAVTAICFIRT